MIDNNHSSALTESDLAVIYVCDLVHAAPSPRYALPTDYGSRKETRR